MENKILFWFGADFTHFCMSYFLQKENNANFYSIVDITNKPKKFFDEQNIVKFKKTWHLHENIQQKNEKIDLEFLKHFEEKYNLNLWKLAINERQFYRFFEFHKFSREEILLILQQEAKFFDSVLDEIKPDFFIAKEPSRHSLQLLYEMCKNLGIKVMVLSSTKIGRRIMISESPTKFNDLDLHNTIEEKTFKELQETLRSSGTRKSIENYIQEHGKSKTETIKAGLNYLFKNNNENIETHYNYFGRTKFSVLIFMLNSIFKKKSAEKYMEKELSKELPNDTSFVYFPLGVDMERNLLISAPFYTNQVEIIRHIAKALPIHVRLIVKETPAQKSREWREISEYKEIQEIPNVILVHPDVSSEEIIKKSSLVMTISGSSGLEAAFFEKPSIIFSDTVYSFLPSVTRIDNIEKLPDEIKNSLNKKVSSHDISSFIGILEKNSFEFDWLGINSKFKNEFYYNGGLVDVDISIERVMNFLSENKVELEKLAIEHNKIIKDHRVE